MRARFKRSAVCRPKCRVLFYWCHEWLEVVPRGVSRGVGDVGVTRLLTWQACLRFSDAVFDRYGYGAIRCYTQRQLNEQTTESRFATRLNGGWATKRCRTDRQTRPDNKERATLRFGSQQPSSDP